MDLPGLVLAPRNPGTGLHYFNRATHPLDEGSTAAQALRIVNGELITGTSSPSSRPAPITVAAVSDLRREPDVPALDRPGPGLGIHFLMTLTVGRRVMVRPFAATAGLLTTVWGWFLVTPNFYSLEAALLSLLALACYVYGAPSWRWMIAAGIAAGLTAMVKQNVGAYTAAGLFITIWASRLFDTEADWRGRTKMSAQFIAGVALPVVPTLLWLIGSGAGPYMY